MKFLIIANTLVKALANERQRLDGLDIAPYISQRTMTIVNDAAIFSERILNNVV
jgi:hypothetical protein